jgi:hypothetical protein
VQRALDALAVRDTARAFAICVDGVAAYGGDPGIHALLADVAVSNPMWQDIAIFEAWAAHRMAPEDRPNMRRWASSMVRYKRYDRGIELFERYLAAGGETAENNLRIRRWIDGARRRMKGGDLAGEGLRAGLPEP